MKTEELSENSIHLILFFLTKYTAMNVSKGTIVKLAAANLHGNIVPIK